MPGQWQFSLQAFPDADGRPLNGALAYFYEAATSDPKTPYAEYSLATALPNPVVADSGFWPSVWLDDSESAFFRVRITDADGVTLRDLTVCQIFGVSAGGETPAEPVDVTGVSQTGDIKARYGESEVSGWRILNGKSIGSSTSGADYANSNAQALFEYLWQANANLAVSGGRGASSLADWSANKRLSLPDFRGYVLAGLDDMGGTTAVGRLTDLTSLDARIGSATTTLVAGNIPLLSFTTASGGGFSANYDGANTSSIGGGGPFGAAAATKTLTVPGHTHTGTVGSSSPTGVSVI
ncbi:MAG: hypothetical protein ABFE07_24220, partial [Armatimonadia bacterium]